jgi:hypothetical protein
MAEITVSIDKGQIVVDQPRISINAETETVSFKGAVPFKIVFDEAGLKHPSIASRGTHWGGECGPFAKRPHGKKVIKYTVTSPGLPDLDPEIEVLP